MGGIGFYTVDENYVNALVPHAPHLFRNARPGQQHSRKYIGVVLTVGEFDYFAPLSSFKPKHRKMRDALDFIKVGDYAVINLNCMFPVPTSLVHRVDFSKEPDPRYRSLLLAEYREVKRLQGKILKSAQALYRLKAREGDSTRLAARCNDFQRLEEICASYAGA